VHFGATTRQLTISFYAPFQHKDNIFHQVGLISLRAVGEILGATQPQNAAPSSQAPEAPNAFGGPMQSLTPIRDALKKKEEQQDQLIMQSFPP